MCAFSFTGAAACTKSWLHCLTLSCALYLVPVLVLALRDAHEMQDVEFSEEMFEACTGALTYTVGVKDAEVLHARASSKVVIHDCGIDAILLVGSAYM